MSCRLKICDHMVKITFLVLGLLSFFILVIFWWILTSIADSFFSYIQDVFNKSNLVKVDQVFFFSSLQLQGK